MTSQKATSPAEKPLCFQEIFCYKQEGLFFFFLLYFEFHCQRSASFFSHLFPSRDALFANKVQLRSLQVAACHNAHPQYLSSGIPRCSGGEGFSNQAGGQQEGLIRRHCVITKEQQWDQSICNRLDPTSQGALALNPALAMKKTGLFPSLSWEALFPSVSPIERCL